MEKLKDSLDFEIVEQLIIEQQQSEDQNKSNKNSVKRHDPKYRALTEAFRQMEDEDHQHNNQSSTSSNNSNASPRKMNYSRFVLHFCFFVKPIFGYILFS